MELWAGGEWSLQGRGECGPELSRGSGGGEEGTLWRGGKQADPEGLGA